MRGFLLVLSATTWQALADSPRPRGVSPEFAKYYKSKGTFTCITNPSIILSSSKVNDDYCDCPDGSDEPGTSACSFLSPLSPQFPSMNASESGQSLALPGFYCKNKGHRPGYVPAHVVNDGVCDYEQCCDGSEEWAHVGGTSCPDRCKEIGKEWRKAAEGEVTAMGKASTTKSALIAEAGRLRREVEDRIGSLGIEIQAEEIKVTQLEASVVEEEKRERGRVVQGSGRGDRMSVLVGLTKRRIEELRGSLVEVRKQRDDRTMRMTELESLLTVFKEDYNPNFNDEGVKRAVRAWEEYSAREKSLTDEGLEEDLEEIVKPDSESEGINWREWEVMEEHDVETLYQLEAYLPASLREWLSTKMAELRETLISAGILAGSHAANNVGESPIMTSARVSLTAGKDRLANLESQLTTHRDDLAKDYGPSNIFRALRDRCITAESGEYVYELCWLARTTQKSRKGGGDTSLGHWVGWGGEELLEGDAKGLGGGWKVAMKYENGQGCWNGPARNTLVVVACAEEDVLWRISEEEKCVYRMEVGSPAVCGEKRSEVKDEL